MPRLEPVMSSEIIDTLRELADKILTGRLAVTDFEYRNRLNEPDEHRGDLVIGWKIMR